MLVRLLLLFILTTSLNLKAEELFDTYRSVRGMAMGGAYTSITQGIDSLFYNPASLADVKGFNLNLLNVNVAATQPNDDVLTSLEGLTDSSTIGQSLQDLYGEPLSAGLGARAGFTLPNFGIAGFAHSDISLNVNNPVIPDFNVNSILDAGVAIGFAKHVNKFMNFGVVLKQVNRYGDRNKFTAANVSSLDPKSITDALDKKGTGYGVDAGIDFLYEGKSFFPKLSVVAKDIGDTSFNKDNNSFGPPPTQEFELVYAGSLVYDGDFASFSLAVDYRHALKEDVSLGKKLHLGLELSLPLIDLRAGWSQGYATYGAGINLGIFRLDATSYGVEIGERAGQQEDRRYMVQLSFDFGFEFNSRRGSGSSSSRASSGGKSGGTFRGAGRDGEVTLGSGGGRRAYKRKHYKNYRKQRR